MEAVTEGRWEYVRRNRGAGAAVIFARTPADELILVEQYRIPLGKPCIELPAGIVGDEDEGEGFAEAASRELEEETGWRAAQMIDHGTFTSTPGLASEQFRLFEARGLERTGPGGGVGDEDIRVHLVPLAEIQAFLEEAAGRGVAIDKSLCLFALLRPF
ncbi:NUDIX hydrolase [Pacificimonas flava]|uniref:GDP-mannose pyrophosphatase n=3 Tax=Sphingosinicellaceae TaxID=2820280 RepID=A0A219B9Z4_9SPHN|nr:NUDIX hydrolase [Pacificimonas aurantium]OWV34629.1 NUDIX hydrolase [Pacificimonas flava]